MKKLVAISFLVLAILACTIPSRLPTEAQLTAPTKTTRVNTLPTQTAPQMYTVCNSGGLNLRTGAGTNYPSTDVLADGTSVEQIDDDTVAQDMSIWRHVKTGTLGGFVNIRYLCKK